MLRGARVLVTLRKRVAGEYVNYTVSEVEVSSSKLHASEMDDGDTRQVVVIKKRRDTSASPPSQVSPPSPSQLPPPPSPTHSSSLSPPGYESPPASQPLPRGDEFECSPASPPLTQSTEREERSPPTLYVLPNASIVVPTDNEPAVYVPDRGTDKGSKETGPEVCNIMIEEALSNLI